MGSPYSRKARRLAKKGIWRREFLRAYGPTGPELGDVTPRCKREIMRAIARGAVVTSTTGGTHAPGSYHYQRVSYKSSSGQWRLGGRAVDIGGGRVALWRVYRDTRARERAHRNAQYDELFGPGNEYVRNGWFYPGQFPGHEDHVHIAPHAIY
jgi:hypothetical protein